MFENRFNRLEKRILQLSNQDDPPRIFSFHWMLLVFSYAYGFGVRLRAWLYGKKILKQKTLPCFVVSIGNIVVGGTGKTPMAICLASLLKKMGQQPVVISRGYKGTYKKDSVIVTDGDQVFCDVAASGDEPYMMAKRKSFPVVVGKDRFKAGMRAMETVCPDVVVLDDGFQHLRLKRDLDILLFDCSRPLGNNRLMPAGRLREPLHLSAHRADVLIFTRSRDTVEQDTEINKVIQQYPDCPWFKTYHVPFVYEQVGHGEKAAAINGVNSLKGRKAILFSGLANNLSFCRTMSELGVNILDHLEFKDHYRYKEADILQINKKAKTAGANVIITTEKDWAKIDHHRTWASDLIVIGIQIAFETPEAFESLLNSRVNPQ